MESAFPARLDRAANGVRWHDVLRQSGWGRHYLRRAQRVAARHDGRHRRGWAQCMARPVAPAAWRTLLEKREPVPARSRARTGCASAGTCLAIAIARRQHGRSSCRHVRSAQNKPGAGPALQFTNNAQGRTPGAQQASPPDRPAGRGLRLRRRPLPLPPPSLTRLRSFGERRRGHASRRAR